METEVVQILKDISDTLKGMKEELSDISTAIREFDMVEDEEE